MLLLDTVGPSASLRRLPVRDQNGLKQKGATELLGSRLISLGATLAHRFHWFVVRSGYRLRCRKKTDSVCVSVKTVAATDRSTAAPRPPAPLNDSRVDEVSRNRPITRHIEVSPRPDFRTKKHRCHVVIAQNTRTPPELCRPRIWFRAAETRRAGAHRRAAC